MNLVFASAALTDLDRLRRFLLDANRQASDDAVEAILAASYSLTEFADRGAPLRGASERRLAIPFGRAAYLLDYQIDRSAETVIILRVRHSREAR